MKKTTNVIDIPISETCLDYGLQVDQSASTTEMAETIANRLRTINNLSMASLSTEMDGEDYEAVLAAVYTLSDQAQALFDVIHKRLLAEKAA